MAGQSKSQQDTIGRVMHEFKHDELRIGGNGPRVKDRAQAVAIALRESGSSNRASAKNRSTLRSTKAKERRGETAQAETEGQSPARRGESGASKTALYAEARRRHISGRSRMSKQELQRALRRNG